MVHRKASDSQSAVCSSGRLDLRDVVKNFFHLGLKDNGRAVCFPPDVHVLIILAGPNLPEDSVTAFSNTRGLLGPLICMAACLEGRAQPEAWGERDEQRKWGRAGGGKDSRSGRRRDEGNKQRRVSSRKAGMRDL